MLFMVLIAGQALPEEIIQRSPVYTNDQSSFDVTLVTTSVVHNLSNEVEDEGRPRVVQRI